MKIHRRKKDVTEKLKVVKHRSNSVIQAKCTCLEITESFITDEWKERVGEKYCNLF